jgi:hypothetical protein
MSLRENSLYFSEQPLCPQPEIHSLGRVNYGRVNYEGMNPLC